MIEVFRFMDSSATSHPVYGIEHSGDAIDTAAIVYLGTSGSLTSTPSDLMVVKNNKQYHIGGWPEDLNDNFHWYYNNKKYDIRSQFRTTSGNRQYSNNEMYVSIVSGSQQYQKIMTGYISLPNIQAALNTLYTTFGREYRLQFMGRYNMNTAGWYTINKYVTKDESAYELGSATNASNIMYFEMEIGKTYTLEVLKNGTWHGLTTLKATNGSGDTLGVSGSSSGTGSKIYGTGGYFANGAKNINLTCY